MQAASRLAKRFRFPGQRQAHGLQHVTMVAFLLTMFNVRLGWWFPNPRRWAWNAKGLRFSLYYLTRELLGTADEDRLFLNVSDGGHFENLGVYELVRRRCKVIIASDAECDECRIWRAREHDPNLRDRLWRKYRYRFEIYPDRRMVGVSRIARLEQ